MKVTRGNLSGLLPYLTFQLMFGKLMLYSEEFALIYISDSGKLRFQFSRAISDSPIFRQSSLRDLARRETSKKRGASYNSDTQP